MRFTSFFKTSEGRIEALRKAVKLNQDDEAWRMAFDSKASELSRAAQDAADQLKGDPCDRTANDYLTARRALQDTDTLRSVDRLSIPELNRRAFERVSIVLPNAMTATLERLRGEREEIAARDAKNAAELGLNVADCTSPVLMRLDAAIATGERLLENLTKATSMSDLHNPIKFCLD